MEPTQILIDAMNQGKFIRIDGNENTVIVEAFPTEDELFNDDLKGELLFELHKLESDEPIVLQQQLEAIFVEAGILERK
jgi:hypothetical protein